MFSRLAQGVSTVLHELSGEEAPDGDPKDGLAPELPDTGVAPEEHGMSEDTLERLAHMEQLVVELKEQVKDKDTQLANTETLLKNERDTAEARFTKLKLQAKAKMASLSKQISELKGQEGAMSPNSSFSAAPGAEEELQELRQRLGEEKASSRTLQERLQTSEQLLREKDQAHAEQLRVMQMVVSEKDVRFQDQVQKHEEELLMVTAQTPNDPELQQTLRAAQRRCEELEEAMRSRSQVLDMLQQELNSADQQKQILTSQFRQMEQELAEATRLREEEKLKWAQQTSKTDADLVALRAVQDASQREEQEVIRLKKLASLSLRESEFEALQASLEASQQDREELASLKEMASLREIELEALRASQESSESEREELSRMKKQISVREVELEALQANQEVLEGEREKLKELVSLREDEVQALQASQEASEREREELKELISQRDAELESMQACQEVSEREREELARLKELVSLREAALEALQANQEALERDRERVAWLERELAALREEQGDGQRAEEALAELWKGVRSLAGRNVEGPGEESHVPTNPAQFLGTLQALDAQLNRLKEELRESEERCSYVTNTMETLHEQLDRSTAEGVDAVARIQQLELQIGLMSGETSAQHVIGSSVLESSDDAKAQISALEQQLLEREEELTTLRDRLAGAEEQHSRDGPETEGEPIPDPSHSHLTASSDSPTTLAEQLEDSTEEETTLVAEDSSILSIAGDIESSPELIGPQSDSNGESKGASSDEMVTSSDSEVAHSSWTLLEAVNQDGGQEWPSLLQDFGQVQLQSWEQTSSEQETSTVQVESSSVVIRETVQVHLNQQGAASISGADSTSGQMFAQALAEELQKRYSELLAEISRLREATTESQEKTQGLNEEIRLLAAAKEEAESRAQNYEEKLDLAKSEMNLMAQHSDSEVEKHSVDIRLLQEQLAALEADAHSKEQRIQVLQVDLDEAQRALSEQEGQARMLGAQLQDKELAASELDRSLQEQEASLLEFTQAKDMAMAALSEKEAEIRELQGLLTQKDQEIMELSDGMSTKLLQAGEEKYQMNGEMKKLRDQILELENAREHPKTVIGEHDTEETSELAGLQKDKDELTTQLSTLKKKFQVAMIQRKELMKKVEGFEKNADKNMGGTPTEETPANISYSEKDIEQEILKMEAMLEETRQALKNKETVVETLEQRNSEKDQALAVALSLNLKLSEEMEQNQLANTAATILELQSQVSSLEAESESLQKKLLNAQEARKDTIRKAKEKDRHHREQLKQQKDDCNELLERFEQQQVERESLLLRLKELEELSEQKERSAMKEAQPDHETKAEKIQKPSSGDWVQQDWVDFAAPENEAQQQESGQAIPDTEKDTQLLSAEMEALKKQVQATEMACSEFEEQLQESQAGLALKESELLKLGEELEALRQNEKQIDSLTEEIEALRDRCLQAETHAAALKAELEAAAEEAASYSGSSMNTLQAEVEEFKHFLDQKNTEIMELSQQLGEQNSLLHSMQDTVSDKDQLIVSLKESLRAEQEKPQKLEAELPQRQEEGQGSEAKIQQLQRKLQAALISRKETLKENKSKKEELASSENLIAELQQKMEAREAELGKLRTEREKLIEEVDRTLLENQSLGASCESLKLAMEGMITEKDACKREADFAKEEASNVRREWEEKVQGLKDEYETLLKSYENVSDEAERVRRVLEAARQERQELAARIRTHEAARQEAERQAEAAQKEVDSVKDKMRKFAKTKQQKIMDLEEENERLRELDERKGIRREDRGVSVELANLKGQVESLNADLEATKAERDSLEQQATELREQLAQELEKVNSLTLDMTPGPDAVVEEAIVAQQHGGVMAEYTQEPVVESQEPEEVEQQTEDTESELVAAETHVDDEKVKMEAFESAQALFEDKTREMEAALQAEKEQRQDREAELVAKLATLEQHLQQSEEQEQSLREESSRMEARLKEMHRNLEAEKDDLEERLMNQLAQLNGSIAGYQQEAADSRERLAELQREVERLERERAELEALAENERDRAARLEEDKRQAQRERAEAEAGAGKQRELEQRLKSAQRVKEGSQSRARQLEELLREKQLEVRQMQKDCIQYQERISEIGKDAKALQHGQDELSGELERARLETSKALEELKKTEGELLSCRAQLVETQRQASQAVAEKAACEQTALQREADMKAEAEQTLDSVRFRLGAELKQAELRLEDSYREREREEEATHEARDVAEGAERQAHKLQARLDESLARLAAFSRCMSSLQDDRDRVLDEAKQWESRFNSTLQGKEAEVREAETRAKDLAEQLQKETAQKEELQLAVDRLQKADEQWQLKWEEEEKRFRQNQAALERERGELQQALTQAESSLAEARAQLDSLESEAEGLRRRAQALEEAVGRLQKEANQARAELREKEAEERRLGLSVEQLETDLRSSKVLTETLQTELSEKERREVELLGEKEQAVAQAAEEARREADGRAKEAEKELEERREEVRVLEDRLRKAEEESSHSKTRLDSFTKAMGSLQDDRDRVLSMYKQLEEKHLQVMMEKDGLIQEAAGENNSLKEELRALLVQRDDLNAEKAKLSAQLHGYRDDLNQVLSMKDSQHKQLLAGQLERIAALERDREELEAKLTSLDRGVQLEGEAPASRLELETLSKAGDGGGQMRDAPGAEVEKLREQLQAARAQVEALEDSLQQERETQATETKELNELRWEGGVMRTESETAQERVAELARDMLMLEQMLLGEKELSAQLKAQNQSFGQAMASLQDSRDQAVNQAQELAFRLEEMSKAAGQQSPTSPGGSTGEVWGLKNALSALQNDRERLLEQLQKQHSELARLGGGDLAKLADDLDEERWRAREMMARIQQQDDLLEREKQELEILQLERIDWQAQAELLKQQTLATLSERDKQVRQLTAMLEEARTPRPNLTEEHYQRQGTGEVDSAPGAPQERGGSTENQDLKTEFKELQRRLDEEQEQRLVVEEQLMAAQERLQRYTQGEWQSGHEGQFSETAVLIEPQGGTVSRSRSGGPGWMRMVRGFLCSRQRTPLLVSFYLLTVHALLLLCLGGYL
ncbi:golgin subfamily B member 1 [Osmerus mordax]|uniref:golgin subfamily B member 1 n=1 Tax=Osmerus mordax TaxID=8014 RepID=UPI00350FC02C